MYIEGSFRGYIEDLGSQKSSPGGGSVAALTGLQGILLVLMVCNLTLGKKRYKGVEEEIEGVRKQAEGVKRFYMEKLDEDVLVFQEIMKAYKLSEAEREIGIKQALLKGALFSLRMAEEGLKVLEYAMLVGRIGNINVKSDAYIGLLHGQLSIESSFTNVLINLEGIKDEGIHLDFAQKMGKIVERAKKLTEDKDTLFKEYKAGKIL